MLINKPSPTTSPTNVALSSISGLALPGAFQFQQPPWPPKYLKPMTLYLQTGQVLLLLINDKLPYKNYGVFVAPYGDCWRFFKKLCKNELLSAHQVEKSRDIRREEMIRFLHKVLESAKKKQVLDMRSELMKLTNNSTCRVVMSVRCSDDNDEAERIRQLVQETTEVSAKQQRYLLGMCWGHWDFWLFGFMESKL